MRAVMMEIAMRLTPILNNIFGGDPFALAPGPAYGRWRAWKIRDYPASAEDLVVPIADAPRLSPGETEALRRRLLKANMAIYDCGAAAVTKDDVVALGARFGLRRLDRHEGADEDGVAALRQDAGNRLERYIPYTDRPIQWHTDGYYNPPERRIRAMMLHCVSAAAEGGDNALFDPELAYLLLRDENPGHVALLSHEEAMTIPENPDAGGTVRAARTGPVFWRDPADGSLGLRYTARGRSIAWRDGATAEAAAHLKEILDRGSRYVFRHRLKPGQGVICNNVLHARTGFRDTAERHRLFYRARYYDRIAGTAPGEAWPREGA
jgi:hypothetical protein